MRRSAGGAAATVGVRGGGRGAQVGARARRPRGCRCRRPAGRDGARRGRRGTRGRRARPLPRAAGRTGRRQAASVRLGARFPFLSGRPRLASAPGGAGRGTVTRERRSRHLPPAPPSPGGGRVSPYPSPVCAEAGSGRCGDVCVYRRVISEPPQT